MLGLLALTLVSAPLQDGGLRIVSPTYETPIDPRPGKYAICEVKEKYGPRRQVGEIFDLPNGDIAAESRDWGRTRMAFEERVLNSFSREQFYISCYIERSLEDAQSQKKRLITEGYVTEPTNLTFGKVAEDSSVKTLVLWLQARRKGESVPSFSAHIDVKYKFIICDSQLHVAYALKPKSIRYFETNEPLSGPFRPVAVRLIATIENDRVPIDGIADEFAGDSLGMGCFDGQLHKVRLPNDGVVRKGEVLREFAKGLTLSTIPMPIDLGKISHEQEYGSGSAQDIEEQDATKARLGAENAAHTAEAARKETAAVADLNAKAAAATKAQTDRINAEQAAGRAAKAKYEADQRRFEAEVAEYDRLKKINDADVEEARLAREAYDRATARK